MFKRLFYHNYKHYIMLLLSVAVVVFVLLGIVDIFNRLWISLKVFGYDFVYYFYNILPEIFNGFGIELEAPKQTLDYLLVSKPVTVIPAEPDLASIQTIIFFRLIISKDMWLSLWNGFRLWLPNISRILLLVVMIIPLVVIWFNNYFTIRKDVSNRKVTPDVYDNVQSKQLKAYLRFKDKVIHPVYSWFRSFIMFALEHKIYLIIIVVALALKYSIIALIFDLFSHYLYFSSAFDFTVLYKIVVVFFIAVGPILLKIPLIVYLIIAYLIFCKIREKLAYQRLYGHEAHNSLILNNMLGVSTFINGTMDSGKTKTMTDMVLTEERHMRIQALEIMREVALKFSYFPYIKLERFICYLFNEKVVVNRTQLRQEIRKRKVDFYREPTPGDIFYYDYCKYPLDIYDGLTSENIFDAISDYAEAYWLYIHPTALCLSNYSIRFDSLYIDNGYFPIWSTDFFRKEQAFFSEEGIPPVIYTSSYSKILDFDILRLSKKVVSNNELASCFDGGVIPITEIGKERLNQLTSQLVNKKIDVANQFNDGFNNFVKMARHFNTIRHRCFIKIFMDDQRAMSLNADLREINEVILYIDRKEKEFNLALGPYWIIPWIQQRIISFWEQYYYRFRAVRSDGTLFIYLISALAGFASRSLERTINTFGYEKMRLQIFQGEKNTDNVAYFLANKKIYSQRYVTDALSDLQEKQYSEAVFGFADLDSYKTVRASQSELAKQHSYFYADVYQEENVVNPEFKETKPE